MLRVAFVRKSALRLRHRGRFLARSLAWSHRGQDPTATTAVESSGSISSLASSPVAHVGICRSSLPTESRYMLRFSAGRAAFKVSHALPALLRWYLSDSCVYQRPPAHSAALGIGGFPHTSRTPIYNMIPSRRPLMPHARLPPVGGHCFYGQATAKCQGHWRHLNASVPPAIPSFYGRDLHPLLFLFSKINPSRLVDGRPSRIRPPSRPPAENAGMGQHL